MTSNEITTALLKATLGKSETEARVSTRRMVKLVGKQHSALLHAIMGQYQMAAARTTPASKLVVASQSEQARLKKQIAIDIHALQLSKIPETIIDPSLISGFVITTSEKRIDRSGKRHLEQLYRAMVT